MKIKPILFIFFSFMTSFVFSDSFSINNDIYITISKPKPLIECVLYDIVNRDKKQYITYLSRNKEIQNSIIDESDDFIFVKNVIDIYKYEKADTILYLKTFFFNNKFYIAHLEKFSYELLLSSFSDKKDIITTK
ncbi:MAG TPA: hypothetical protein PK771_11825, partial [Spirochaetota bacterium]|nr:hypothetical protein [Spirochaetota bacterium]